MAVSTRLGQFPQYNMHATPAMRFSSVLFPIPFGPHNVIRESVQTARFKSCGGGNTDMS